MICGCACGFFCGSTCIENPGLLKPSYGLACRRFPKGKAKCDVALVKYVNGKCQKELLNHVNGWDYEHKQLQLTEPLLAMTVTAIYIGCICEFEYKILLKDEFPQDICVTAHLKMGTCLACLLSMYELRPCPSRKSLLWLWKLYNWAQLLATHYVILIVNINRRTRDCGSQRLLSSSTGWSRIKGC